VLPGREIRQLKNDLIEAAAVLIKKLCAANLAHRDFKASNLLVQYVSGATLEKPEIWLLDLDGLHKSRRGGSRAAMACVVRLAASLIEYPPITQTDLARLIKRTLREIESSDTNWRIAFRRAANQASNYARAARGRKAHKLDGYAASLAAR
jgi:hypothetical protein